MISGRVPTMIISFSLPSFFHSAMVFSFQRPADVLRRQKLFHHAVDVQQAGVVAGVALLRLGQDLAPKYLS